MSCSKKFEHVIIEPKIRNGPAAQMRGFSKHDVNDTENEM